MIKLHILYVLLGTILVSLLLYLLPKTSINNDASYQIQQAISFLNGKGFSQCYADLNDLSQINCQETRDFALGYPITIAPLLRFFTIRTSVAIIDGVSAFLFLLSSYILINNIKRNLSSHAILIFLFFFSLSPLLFFFNGVTDLLSLAFYILSLALVCKIILYPFPKTTSLFLGILIGVTSYLCCFYRYAYYFFVLIPPFFLFSYAYFFSRRIVSSGLVSIFTILFLLFLQFIYQSGSAYISARHPDSGDFPYWQNLLKLDNFVLKSFISTYIINIVGSKFGLQTILILVIEWMLALILITVIIIGLFKIVQGIVRSKKDTWINNPVILIVSMGLITILVNVSTLILLSLRFKGIVGDWYWTYVEETRYYAPTHFFIVLFIILISFSTSNLLKKYKALYLFLLRAAIFFNVCTLGLNIYSYFSKKSSSNHVADLADVIHTYQSGITSVFVTTELRADYASYARMGGAVLVSAEAFFNNGLKTSKPLHLFIAIPTITKLENKSQSLIEAQITDQALKRYVTKNKLLKITTLQYAGQTDIYYCKYIPPKNAHTRI